MQIETFLRRNIFHARLLAKLSRHLENAWEVWQAYRADQPATRLVVRGGPTITARPHDQGLGLFLEIFVDRCYFPPGFYQPGPGDTIVDLGANIGVFDLCCQTLAPGVRMHAVEPDPATYTQLRRNLESNGFDSAVTTYNLAISDRRGSLYADPSGTMSGHRAFHDTGAGEPIPCITLDDLFERAGVERCDLLKIDTEGAEIPIIEGASHALWSRVQHIALEHHDNPRSGDRLESYLTGLGYTCSQAPIPGYPHLGMLYATRA